MLESVVEGKLKWLEGFGFKSLKLRTPGSNGVMDRLILWPTWSPGAPVLVEAKRPGKAERALQAAVRDDWRARGCDVRDMIDTPEKAQRLCDTLLVEAVNRWTDNTIAFMDTPDLPRHIIDNYHGARTRL